MSQWLLTVLKESRLIRPFLEKEIKVGHMLDLCKHQHLVKVSARRLQNYRLRLEFGDCCYNSKSTNNQPVLLTY